MYIWSFTTSDTIKRACGIDLILYESTAPFEYCYINSLKTFEMLSKFNLNNNPAYGNPRKILLNDFEYINNNISNYWIYRKSVSILLVFEKSFIVESVISYMISESMISASNNNFY